MSAKLPGLQPVRTGDPAQDRFLEAVRERLEVREGVRGDPLEAVVLQRDLVELGIKKQSRVALPDGKPGFVTQLADGSFSAISADELVSRLEGTDWYRSLASAPGGVTDSTRQSILSAITEEISKRGAEDRRLDSVMAGIREELLRKIGDLAARVSGASAAPPTPNNYDTFTVTLLSDNTRVFTFAYTTTPAPSDLAGAVIRFKKGATGTELWGAMSPLHEGVLTNSPIETRAGDPDVYRFAIKARTRSGMESTDATVRYVDITLPALSGTESIIQLDASTLAFAFTTAGTAYPAAQSSILTLTRTPTSLSGTATWSATAFDSSGTQIGSTGGVALTGTGDTRTLTTSNFMAPGGSFDNNIQYVNVTATLGTLSKSVRVIRITDGVEPILSFLTNSSVTLPASSAGVVSSWAGATGDFQVWQGGVEVTTGITYAIQANPSSLTATINSSTGIYSVTAAGSWADASNTTNITFRATHTASGAYRDAVFTLAKAVTGAAGSNGSNGSNGTNGTNGTNGADAVVYEIEPSPSSVARNNIGVATPSAVTFYAYSKTGSAARAAFSGRFTIETFIDPTWTGKYTSVSNESSTTYTVPASVTAIRVKLYANGSLSPLLQQVTVPVVPDGIRSPMTLNSNSSATAVYGTVTSGTVNWTDAKGNEVVWRKLGYTSAPSATPADYLVRTDLVTLFDASPPTAGVKPATRYWTGSAWADPGTVIDGNLLVKGTVTMDSLKSGSTISTSGVSFGLGVSWGPGSSPSGGYFHSTVSTSFALVADNVAGGYSIASATTATNDSGAAFVGGGGWTGYTTSGGVTSGGTYTTSGFIATGTAGGIFRYGSTAEVRLGETTGGNVSAGRFTQGSYVGLLGTASAAVKASYSTTQVVSLGTSSYAVDITAGSMRYNGVILDSPPASANFYLNGNGHWGNLLYLGTGGRVATWDGSAKPGDNNTTNTWAQISISGTEYLIPVWAI